MTASTLDQLAEALGVTELSSWEDGLACVRELRESRAELQEVLDHASMVALRAIHAKLDKLRRQQLLQGCDINRTLRSEVRHMTDEQIWEDQ